MSHAMSFVTMNLVTMMYLIASVCFIQALKGLSSPSTARTSPFFTPSICPASAAYFSAMCPPSGSTAICRPRHERSART